MAEIIPGSGIDFDFPDQYIGGIPVFTAVEGFGESLDRDQGGSAERVYYCRWGDRFALANALCGFSSVSGGRGGAVSFNQPHNLVESPSLFATRVRLKGIGAYHDAQAVLNRDRFGPAFPLCRVMTDYNVLPYSTGVFQDPNTTSMGIDDATSSMIYATQSLSLGGEPMEIPASALQYSFDNGGSTYKYSKSMVVNIRHASLRVTFYALPYFPVNTLPLYGCVNDKDGFLGGAKGTVKFGGSEVQRDYQNGGVVQTMTNLYEYRPSSDWNFVPNPFPDDVPAIWARVAYKADGSPIFPYKDLTQTFPSVAYGGS